MVWYNDAGTSCRGLLALNDVIKGGIGLQSFNFFFFSSRRRHTRFDCDWSSEVCSSDLHHYERYLDKLRSLLYRWLPNHGNDFARSGAATLGHLPETSFETAPLVQMKPAGTNEFGRVSQ